MARNVYTVKQVNAYIKNMFTQDFMLNRIYVKGEVSNCKYHTSGHIYFSLKDESGTIACVMFAGQRGGLSFHMREGQQIIVLGSVNVYERTGAYQLYANEIRLDGEGALYEKYQMLKQELEEMGMFAPEYKQQIPAYGKADRCCDCADGSCSPGYHEYICETQSVCTADSLSGSGAWRMRQRVHCAGKSVGLEMK